MWHNIICGVYFEPLGRIVTTHCRVHGEKWREFSTAEAKVAAFSSGGDCCAYKRLPRYRQHDCGATTSAEPNGEAVVG